MILTPKTLGSEAVVQDIREQFSSDHVHAVLIVHNGALLAVVQRSDLEMATNDQAPALSVGRVSGRVVAGDHPLEAAHRSMTESGTRRLAVVDEDGRLAGLLCLKRHGRGFCSAEDLQSSADESGRSSR